uniref:Aminoglycoside phosphotransferase n=1 Tax=Tanacetum cinerariifolium TaxID=118510 RepID=A0A6L2N398_TANCI|nr:aminoglycoside phosphotransferase [Tanacetum cinerariifolium]
MQAFESFITAAKSGGGEDLNGDMAELGLLKNQSNFTLPTFQSGGSEAQPVQTRAALAFLLSEKGNFFREFLLDEIVKGIDAVTREQLVQVMSVLGIRNPTPVFSMVPSFGTMRPTGLIPYVTEEDKIILNNVQKIIEFLIASDSRPRSSDQDLDVNRVIQELLPIMPGLSATVLPEVLSRLSSRVIARLIRDTFL